VTRAKKAARKKAAKPRRGLPRPDSVVAEVPFTSPGGRSYRILRTTERDAYETVPAKRKKKT